MGSGLHLQTNLDADGCMSTLDSLLRSYRTPKYKHLPSYFRAGWVWNQPDDRPPDTVVSFTDASDEFILATFWSSNQGSELGLFPLGSGDDRLAAMPIVEDWNARDKSLSSVGVVPAGSITLRAPRIDEAFFAEMAESAGLPAQQPIVEAVGLKVGEMFLIKAYEFLSSQDQRAYEHFRQTHHFDGGPLDEFCQATLDDLTAYEPGLLPYIQDLPMRVRAIMLEQTGTDGSSFWTDLARTT